MCLLKLTFYYTDSMSLSIISVKLAYFVAVNATFKLYSESYSPSDVNEDTFVKDILTAILKAYFPNDAMIHTNRRVRKSTYLSARQLMEVTVEQMAKTKSRSHGKGDLMDPTGLQRETSVCTLAMERRTSPYTFFECKPPRANKSDDFVKVGNCLKDCLDESAAGGARTSTSRLTGIVCEGKVA